MKLLVIVTLISVVAAAQPNCMPTNWNYRWQLFKGSWYTQLDTARPWAEQVEKCKAIEPNQMASIASINDADASKMVGHRFQQSVWVGGFELGNSRTFMWYNNGPGICGQKGKVEMKPILGDDDLWARIDMPAGNTKGDNYYDDKNCIHRYSYLTGGNVDDSSQYTGLRRDECMLKKKAVCQLRC